MSDLEEALGHRFRDAELLEQALTHASTGQEGSSRDASNERLEFLGDAVLDLLIADELFSGHPDWREGQLTWTRAALVNTRELAQRARELDLGKHLRLGKSERQGRGALKETILANAFEAVVGALYLDAGLEPVRVLVRRLFADALDPDAPPPPRDAKMLFQEWAHRAHRTTPTWRVLSDSGDDGDPERFVAIACLGEEEVGRGVGPTKRAAEREAALDALAAAGDE
jgi:ribonuclease-3